MGTVLAGGGNGGSHESGQHRQACQPRFTRRGHFSGRAHPERFERQARRHPARLAVKTRKRQLTYAELNRLANRVAHAILAAHGDQAEPAALLMEKETTLFAAIFGILKAAKYYVPLSPS